MLAVVLVTNYQSYLSFKLTCFQELDESRYLKPDTLLKYQIEIKYPFDFDHTIRAPTDCYSNATETIHFHNWDLKALVNLFIGTALFDAIYSSVSIFSSVFVYSEYYRKHKLVSIMRFNMTLIMALLWLISSWIWFYGLKNLITSNSVYFFLDKLTFCKGEELSMGNSCLELHPANFTYLKYSLVSNNN